jgi:fructose-specific phosphotransferase system IIA component
MLLTEILSLEHVKVPLTAGTKEGVIRELMETLSAGGAVADLPAAIQSVLDRERTRTTGIGSGLAIPHGKTSAVRDLVMAMGRTAVPIDFESIDGKPVTLVILLLSPLDKTGPHIQALARISRMFSADAFRNKLNAAPTAAEVYRLIGEQEAREQSE